MATSTRTRRGATSTPEFEILDSAPTFRTAPGREKTALRRQIEALEPGQFLVAARLSDVTGEDDEDTERKRKNALASVRQKAQAVTEGNGVKYSVRRDDEDRVIVFVKPAGEAEDSDA